ncbi:MAG: ABC transporter permease [Calditrichae bacterium]|nr:ABC transporter permease [Calditrichia bacterium]
MRKTLKLIKREFISKVFSKGFVISTVLGPIIIMGFYYIPAYFRSHDEARPQVIQIVDYSGVVGERLPDLFDDKLENGQPRFVLSPVAVAAYENDPETFHQSIEDGIGDVLLILPEDILEHGTATYMATSVTQFDLIRLVRQRIGAAVNQLRLQNAGLDPQQVRQLTMPVGLKTVKISSGEAEEKGFESEWPVTIVFLTILYMTILIYGAAVMRGVLEEKTSRILEILLSSGNAFQLMLGKLFGVGSVGLVQYVAWAVIAYGSFFLVNQSSPEMIKYVDFSPGTFFYFVLFFLLGYFQFSALYAAVGAMCSNQEDAQALSSPITFLIIIPFLITVSLDANSSLAQILSLLPFFAPMLMFMRVQLSNPAGWEIALSVGINVLAILLFTWLAAKIYRVGTLMYGKRPSLREVARWLKYQ